MKVKTLRSTSLPIASHWTRFGAMHGARSPLSASPEALSNDASAYGNVIGRR